MTELSFLGELSIPLSGFATVRKASNCYLVHLFFKNN